MNAAGGPDRGAEPYALTQEELAARWRISPRTLERWRSQAFGPRWLQLGGRLVYRMTEVRAYEAEHLRGW